MSDETKTRNIDPELLKAVDGFFDGWKEQVLDRLETGEEQYHGRWKEMTETEVLKELMDEVLDMIAYAVFLRSKTETLAPGADNVSG